MVTTPEPPLCVPGAAAARPDPADPDDRTGQPPAAPVGVDAPASLDRLREMAAAPEASRVELRDRFIADHRKLFRLLAHRLCRSVGLQAALHRDDVEQVIALGAVVWVDELVAEPDAIESIANFEGLLYVRSRAAVRAYADRELSPASGMISLQRRVRRLNQLRDELRATTGTEPADREVTREHNRRVAATRADAARQGMLASTADLAVASPVADIHALDLALAAPEDAALHAAEGPGLVRAVIERARAVGGITADVAGAWLSGIYDSEGAQRVLTPREVAEHLGIPPEQATAQIRKVRALARRVLAETLGIDHA